MTTPPAAMRYTQAPRAIWGLAFATRAHSLRSRFEHGAVEWSATGKSQTRAFGGFRPCRGLQ